MTVRDDESVVADPDTEPDDVVANALLDALDRQHDAGIARVLNSYVEARAAAPTWPDYRRTVERCDVVARWPADDAHGETILVRGTDVVGEYERVATYDGAVAAQTAATGGGVFERLLAIRGEPELMAPEAVRAVFEEVGSA